MNTSEDRARLLPVKDVETRGQAFTRRREALSLSVRQLATEMGIDRATLTKAEADDPSVKEKTLAAIEDWLSEREHEREHAADDAGPTNDDHAADSIELSVSIGALDWVATAKGPRADAEVIQRQLAELMKVAMREARGGPTGRDE
jgi:DNA-binding XRE family transcriptional regulator